MFSKLFFRQKLLLASAVEGESTEEGMSFVLNLEVNSTQFDSALQVGSGVENAPATLAAITEFSWMEGEELHIIDTLPPRLSMTSSVLLPPLPARLMPNILHPPN